MVNVESIRTVVGVIGNVISFGLFASPMPTFWRIIQNKAVEEFSFLPYVATVMNCLFWIFYGLPVVHPDSTLVVTINSIGLALELCYLGIFIYFSEAKRWKVVGFVCFELVFIGAIAAVTLTQFHTYTKRSMFVGIFCVVFGVMMYASPLGIMKRVIQTKSVEYMPFWISVAGFLNGLCWLCYALLKFDLYITIGNGSGAALGAIQLALYAFYYKSTPKKGRKKKTSEVQLPNASPV
ncbi:bidirectional sugar transporter SWEET6b-like [Cornus florida]|uniref:bidirectional sugar transporter SWEET6b-like n=1 Tax=Cornus florida TaxID=4283 RepID=UPI002898B24A|nr:bidirectional sugar transporter SWEET6b-like [Cornus florida]